MAKTFKKINVAGSYESCPTCGAGIRLAVIGSTHVNGEQNEDVTFDCGCRVKYSPNFSCILVEYDCPKTKKANELEKNLQDCRERLIKIINRCPIPAMYKATFLDVVKEFKRDHFMLYKYRHLEEKEKKQKS